MSPKLNLIFLSASSFFRECMNAIPEDGSFANSLIVSNFGNLKAAWEWMESEPFYIRMVPWQASRCIGSRTGGNSFWRFVEERSSRRDIRRLQPKKTRARSFHARVY